MLYIVISLKIYSNLCFYEKKFIKSLKGKLKTIILLDKDIKAYLLSPCYNGKRIDPNSASFS